MMKFLLASVAVFGMSAPALAQDFTGPRVEVRVGMDRVNFELPGDEEEFETQKNTGISYGGELGYDLPMGDNSIFGVYGGFDLSKAEFCESEDGLEGCLEANNNLTVGVRGGAAVGSTALVYVKGGYSRGQFQVDFDDELDDLDLESTKEDLVGWHLGAGAEMKFGTGLYGKLEYVYTEYNKGEFLDTDEDELFRLDAGRHQVLLGVGVRF